MGLIWFKCLDRILEMPPLTSHNAQFVADNANFDLLSLSISLEISTSLIFKPAYNELHVVLSGTQCTQDIKACNCIKHHINHLHSQCFNSYTRGSIFAVSKHTKSSKVILIHYGLQHLSHSQEYYYGQ
jgi:hypothetical protein